MAKAYTPSDGLKNTTSFPSKPGSGAASRKQVQDMLDQMLGFHNEHIADTEWTEPTLQNGWVNFGAPLATVGYRKDTHNYVRIKGTIKDGTVTVNTVLFTLPVGYRPSEHRYFAVYSSSVTGSVVVYNTGAVCIISGSAAGLSLDGIIFEAA
jgi:hypothetical protein